MGDRRERKSSWDVSEDNRHSPWTGKDRNYSHDGRNHHEFSSSRSYGATKSRDGQQSYWESLVEEAGSLNNSTFFRKEKGGGGGNRYFQNMSPGLDGMDRQKYDRETFGSNSRRHLERSRSRSRSRSRTRGRSRSRSLSRGRMRERDRSRSRSRGDTNSRAELKTRGPIADSRQYSWSDRRNGPGDATANKTEAGCNISDVDNNLSDAYRGWDGRFPSRNSHSHSRPFSRAETVIAHSNGPCREFVKGKCRWGDSCRFSHRLASEEKEPSRHSHSESEAQNQPPYKDAKPLCKFFAIGKCSRDDCRFSHDDPRAATDERRNDTQPGHGWGGSDRKKPSAPIAGSAEQRADPGVSNESEVRDAPMCSSYPGEAKELRNSGHSAVSNQEVEKVTPNDPDRHYPASLNGFGMNLKGSSEAELVQSLLSQIQNKDKASEIFLPNPAAAAAEIADPPVENGVSGPDNVGIDVVSGSSKPKPEEVVPGNKEEDEEEEEEAEAVGKAEEESSSRKRNDKSLRLFKNSLIDLVKDLLKPTWKEGRMSREVHKTVVKKVVDKITGTIRTDHIPKTQDKVDHYLKHSKTKISKLVQAYVGRNLKKGS